ncbi:hypothetical protein CDAR_535121 [Caerostris darwini]|uniref:C2H2-type domain-containing protein n=1 Tax=Caerostris darwini TaxID=1538125 RepID=A0AAV4QJN2_9ARAC|nr:hypothetical protein CDAR_535121 [Caerostris darwini]
MRSFETANQEPSIVRYLVNEEIESHTIGLSQMCTPEPLNYSTCVDTDEDFTCPYCQRRLFNQTSLQRHIQLHLQSKDRGFQCNICSRVYSSKNYIKEHKRTVHNLR